MKQIKPMLAQKPLRKGLQVSVTEEAAIRIKVEAAKRGTTQGRIVSNLAMEHLAEVGSSK